MKRLLPWAVFALTVFGVAAVVMWVSRTRAAPEPPLVPTAIRPTVWVVNDGGVISGAGYVEVPAAIPFDLRITLEASAFVYVFDESESQLTLVWKHEDAAPWEAGEYLADAPAFERLGEHQLTVVASPTALTTIDTWQTLDPRVLGAKCPACEAESYTFYVRGRHDAGDR